MQRSFGYIFSKRALICFILAIILFFISILRVAKFSLGDYTEARKQYTGIRLTIGKSRGTIYDCNRFPLTNTEEKIIAALTPTPLVVTAIRGVLEGDELESVLERLKGGKPILCELPEEIQCDGIICTKKSSTPELIAKHIIGYTDTDGRGITGIEKAFDKILYSEEEISVYYETDAKSRVLEGVEPLLTNPNKAYSHGVVTTLDINIQSIAEKHAEHLKKGAILVSEVESGKIRACVSRPDFDPDNLKISLNNIDSPLLNRAINTYNVGSVFKPCVAAAGIENGFGGYTHTCKGSLKIADRNFRCHKLDGHGFLDLRGGLAHSCNTYFYNFSFLTGGKSILKTANALSFNQSIRLCDGIIAAKGNLPSQDTLLNIAQLANFSIGQGELLLSPISMLNLYSAIANKGQYCLPALIEGTIINGAFKPQKENAPTKVMKENTAKILGEYLKSVLLEGTGETAKPKTVSAAGKTATAQTGKFIDGKEICQGWFCGYFPADNPKYVVVVFSEDINMQTLSCGEIFALIADDIMNMI